MVGERQVTVLLAKLYADRMISTKETAGDLSHLPDNVPDLMRSYLNELNGSVQGFDNRTVQKDCMRIAWICVRESLRPGLAKRDVVRNAMAENGGAGDKSQRLKDADERLTYLEKRLGVIQAVGPTESQLRYSLDPLAEYMAALHLVDAYGEDSERWRSLLSQADSLFKESEAIRGFLLAQRDCCLASDGKIPEVVIRELGRRGGIDPGATPVVGYPFHPTQHTKFSGLAEADAKVLEVDGEWQCVLEYRITHVEGFVGVVFERQKGPVDLTKWDSLSFDLFVSDGERMDPHLEALKLETQTRLYTHLLDTANLPKNCWTRHSIRLDECKDHIDLRAVVRIVLADNGHRAKLEQEYRIGLKAVRFE